MRGFLGLLGSVTKAGDSHDERMNERKRNHEKRLLWGCEYIASGVFQGRERRAGGDDPARAGGGHAAARRHARDPGVAARLRSRGAPRRLRRHGRLLRHAGAPGSW